MKENSDWQTISIIFIKRFGKEYTRHAEITEEVKQKKNDDNYRNYVMVGLVYDHSLSYLHQVKIDFVGTLIALFPGSTHQKTGESWNTDVHPLSVAAYKIV